DLQAEIPEQHLAVITLTDLLQGHRLAMQLLVLLEADEGADPAGGLDLLELDLVDLPRPAGGLLGLGGIGREAADELLQLGDLQAEIPEQDLAVITLTDLLQGRRLAMQLLVLLEADEGADPAGGLDLLELDLVDLPRPAGGLLGLGGIGREAADELLQLGDLRLLLGVVRQQTFPGLGGGGHVDRK